MNEEIRYLGDVRKLTLAPGDVLVIECPGRLTQGTADAIRHDMETLFPGQRVMVLTGGMKLGVVAKAA